VGKETKSKPPDQQRQTTTITVGKSVRHRRIDKYLHKRFSNFSRVQLQKMIKDGDVKLNGKRVKRSSKISPGDQIEMIFPEVQKQEILPEDIPLDIIYEDESIIVINKQADIIVHPARGNTHGTLVNALVHHTNKLSSGLGELRPGIVHRLDRNTTGVMVVAKNDKAQGKIAKQFQKRVVQKEYVAVVHGTPELDSDRIKAPLGVHPRRREKYSIRPGVGKESVTFYEVLEVFRGYALLKLSPKTGRTHQLRVHLSYIKHPIVADDMYGGKLVYAWQLADKKSAVESPIINRPALHANFLKFRHPETDKFVSFESVLPEDMKTLLEHLRKYRSE